MSELSKNDEEKYQHKGCQNRIDYLMTLSVEYGVPYDAVVAAAESLGQEQDFGELPALLEKWGE